MILCNQYLKVEKVGNTIEKTFLCDPSELFNYSEEWLDAYQKFHKLYGCVPEIYEATPNKIVMEYIDGIRLDEYQIMNKKDKLVNIKIAEQCVEIFHNCLEFSISIGNLFLHSDMHPKNYIMKDNSLYLIDPDSFKLYSKDFLGFGKLILELSKNYTSTEILNLEDRIK